MSNFSREERHMSWTKQNSRNIFSNWGQIFEATLKYHVI